MPQVAAVTADPIPPRPPARASGEDPKTTETPGVAHLLRSGPDGLKELGRSFISQIEQSEHASETAQYLAGEIISAVRALRGKAKSEVKANLLRLLRSDEAEEQYFAAEILAGIITKKDKALIVGMLESSAQSNTGVVYLLGKTPFREAEAPIVSMLQRATDTDARELALDTLTKINPKRANVELENLMKAPAGSDDRKFALQQVARALKENLPVGLVILRESFKEIDRIEDTLALVRLRDVPDDILAKPEVRTILSGAFASRKFDASAADALCELLVKKASADDSAILREIARNESFEPKTRRDALQTLGQFPSEENMKAVEHAANDNLSIIRSAAAETAGRLRNDSVFGARSQGIVERLAEDPASYVAVSALLILGGEKATKSDLESLGRLIHSVQPELPNSAIQMLARHAKDPEHKATIAAILAQLPPAEPRTVLAIQLEKLRSALGDPDSGARLLGDLRGENRQAAQETISYIVRENTPASAAIRRDLISVALNEQDNPEIRSRALALLNPPSDPSTVDVFLKLTESKNPLIRLEALRGCAGTPEERTQEHVLRAFPGLTESDRANIVNAIGLSAREKLTTTASQLLHLAAQDESPEVSRSAVRHLLFRQSPEEVLGNPELQTAVLRSVIRNQYDSRGPTGKYLGELKNPTPFEALVASISSANSMEQQLPLFRTAIDRTAGGAKNQIIEAALTNIFSKWDDTELPVRLKVGEWLNQVLSEIGKASYNQALVHVLEDYSAPRAQQLVARTLDQNNPQQYGAVYARMLFDPRSAENPSLRGNFEQNVYVGAAHFGIPTSTYVRMLLTDQPGFSKTRIDEIEQMYVRARNLNISFPMRFSDATREEIFREREQPSTENKPLAVVVFPKSDWNGAFHNTKQIDSLLRHGYRVRYLEADSDDGLVNALKNATGREQASLIVFGGHGDQRSLQLGEKNSSDPKDHSHLLDLTDEEKLKAARLNDLLKPGEGRIVLLSCSTGEGRKEATNLANMMRAVFPDAAAIFAPTAPSFAEEFRFDDKNNVIGVVFGKEGIDYQAKVRRWFLRSLTPPPEALAA